MVAASVALAGFGAYEYSQYSYETGVANGLSTQASSLGSVTSSLSTQVSSLGSVASSYSTQVSSLSSASSTLQTQLSQAQANLASLISQSNSLQTQLTQANANVASLQGQLNTLNGQIIQLQGQISTFQSLLNLSVTNSLISSQTFNLPPGGSASSTTFPFVSVSTPRSWGDVGVVVAGQPPGTPRVSQTGTQDCILVTGCTVGLNGAVAAGDILLVFVSGYSPNAGWRVQSVTDSFGTSFTLYNGANWQASTNTYLDYVYYGIATPSGSPDSVTVTYSSQAQHSDPIVMDVTGSGLSMFNGVSAVCTASCSTSIATSPATLAGSYLAAAMAYDDLGGGASAGPGWTQVSTPASVTPGVSFMTGEYSTNVGGGGGCSVLPLLPPNYVAKYAGYLSITGTTSSTAAVVLVTYPGTTQTTATYPLGTAVSAIIPIIPGNVIVQLENCGAASLSATLTVKEVT